jgi:ribose 5-phosphate isomerase
MEKSFDLIVDETKIAVAKTLNESGLPITVLNMLLNELVDQTKQTAQSVIIRDRQKYQQELKAAEEKKVENKKTK